MISCDQFPSLTKNFSPQTFLALETFAFAWHPAQPQPCFNAFIVIIYSALLPRPGSFFGSRPLVMKYYTYVSYLPNLRHECVYQASVDRKRSSLFMFTLVSCKICIFTLFIRVILCHKNVAIKSKIAMFLLKHCEGAFACRGLHSQHIPTKIYAPGSPRGLFWSGFSLQAPFQPNTAFKSNTWLKSNANVTVFL